MSTSKIQVGQEVVRIDGGSSYAGRIGTVIELSGGRVRVNWTKIHSYRDPSNIVGDRTSNRTWVKISSVHDVAIPYTFTIKKTPSKKLPGWIDRTLIFSIK